MLTGYTSGFEMHQWVKDLFPINRSLTGPGVRETLAYLSNLIPGMVIHSVPSGTAVYDWIIPDEWIVHQAYVEDESGRKIIDFDNNNLHVVGYSIPIDSWVSFEELNEHLYSLPDLPDAIPYVTSYYKKHWGFCISETERKKLKKGKYRIVINCEFVKGFLNYGEVIIPGKTKAEIFLSTYICHPSMANNELSGPAVTAALAKWIDSLSDRRYTYRIIFIPETIGAITYLSRNIETLKKNVIAGFQITCIGDDRCYSFLPSRKGNTLADKAAIHVLKNIDPHFKQYSFLNRGSDERQYCSPGVDLPMASIMRSKYGEYKEYHTSLDDLTLVTPDGLQGGYEALRKTVEALEHNCFPKVTVLCEPQLGKRGLYPTLSTTKPKGEAVKVIMNLIAYSDGTMSLIDIAETINVPVWELISHLKKLQESGLLTLNIYN